MKRRAKSDGYTEIYDQNVLFHLTTAMYEKITTSIASYGHGATVSVPAEWVGVVATFRGADTN
jgi:putative transposon-encoded protein